MIVRWTLRPVIRSAARWAVRWLLAGCLAVAAAAGLDDAPRAAAAPRGPTLDLTPPAGGAALTGTASLPSAAALPPAAALPRAADLVVDPGGVAAFALSDRPPVPGARPRLRIADQEQEFWPVGDLWVALVPVSYWTEPGPLSVEFSWTVGEAALAEARFTLAVVDKEFPVDHLRVSSSLAARRSEDRLQADAVRTQAARSQTSPRPLWDGPFSMPATGRRSSEFGVIRMLNGTPTGRHSGLDLAGPEGTPIHAAGSGQVVLADWLYVTGGTVIIDHGLGLFTSYAHLSRLAVVEGQRVRQGEVIGEMGATGFATGSHLHWSAWIRHTPVNPEDLLRPPLADLLLEMVR